MEGEELVILSAGEQGLEEVWRHQLSVPGQPRILDEHYPDHPNGRSAMQPRLRPQREEERAFLAIGEGAERWLREAAASGATRVRTKMAQATELGSPESGLRNPFKLSRQPWAILAGAANTRLRRYRADNS